MINTRVRSIWTILLGFTLSSLNLTAMDHAITAFKNGAYLPPPTEVSLDIRRQGGQFFQYWLLTGSFHIDSFDEYAPDFLKPMGGEANARPFPGMRFTDTTGIERTWSKYDSPKQGEVDFKSKEICLGLSIPSLYFAF